MGEKYLQDSLLTGAPLVDADRHEVAPHPLHTTLGQCYLENNTHWAWAEFGFLRISKCPIAPATSNIQTLKKSGKICSDKYASIFHQKPHHITLIVNTHIRIMRCFYAIYGGHYMFGQFELHHPRRRAAGAQYKVAHIISFEFESTNC